MAPSAFTAEARATQQFGEALMGFGRELGNLSDKIALAQEQDQFDDGILEYAKILDDQDSELTKNRNYSREIFEKAFDERTDKIKSNTKSKGALKRLTKYFARQRIVEGIRTETKIHRLRVAEARLKIPIVVNEWAQKFADDETPEGQKQLLNRINEKLSNDVKSGVLSEAEAQDAFRRFAMMTVREHAERDPKRAIQATKSRASLKELGLTKEMIASLTAEDLDTLQEDARQELNYAQDKADAVTLKAIAEVKAEAASMAGKEDFAGAQRFLNANIGLLGLQEHKLQSKNLEETSEYFSDTGINYYKVTHKPSVYADLRRQILNGTLTDDALVWQKTGFNGISEADATRLSKMIPDGGTESDFKNSAAAKIFEELLEEDAIFIGIEGIFARETGFRWLEDALKKNPDWTLRQQQEEAMRIFYRVQADYEAGRITTRPEDLPREPLTPEQVRKGMKELDKIDLAEIRKRRLKRQESQIRTITTQEQYDALPIGTRYRDANGAIGTKR